jgi:hypothetical protein
MKTIEIPIDVAISITTQKMVCLGNNKMTRLLQYLVKFADCQEDLKDPTLLANKAKESILKAYPEMADIEVNVKEKLQVPVFLKKYVDKYGNSIKVDVDENKEVSP